MVLKNYIDDFLLSKEIEEGCSQNTVKAYNHDLMMFNSTLPGDIELDRISHLHIRKFLKILKDKGYTKVGIARKIAALKSFFKFLEISEEIKKNPMMKISTPKIRREESLPKFLSLQEMQELLEFTKKGVGIPYTTRKRAYLIIRILYATMARVSELSSIKVGDINFKERTIRIRGKGNKERIVPIDKETLGYIKEYLNNRILYTNDDPLLINNFGGALSTRSIQDDISIIKKKLGLRKDKKLTPHIFRHTGATHLRQAGMDISELQDLLGHASPNTTRIYAKNDLTRIKQEFDDKHPLARES